MRKPGALLFSVPVALGGLLVMLLRRSPVARAAGAVGIACAAVVLVLAFPPARSNAVPASAPAPVSADLFRAIGTAHAPVTPFTILFDQPMDPGSVAAALSIEPAAPYALAWDRSGRRLTVTPAGHWTPDTIYRILVATSARSETGGRLAAPMRTAVLTSSGGRIEVAPTLVRASTGGARLDTAFRIRLDHPASLAAVRGALHTSPVLAGTVTADADPASFRFIPDEPLAPDTDYRVWLVGLVDADGVPFAATYPAEIHTTTAPTVRAIRPRASATRVERDAGITIRFSEAMDEPTTTAALQVTARRREVAGRVTWSADARTVTFTPKRPLAYGAVVGVKVGGAARSAAGVPLATPTAVTFTVRARPATTTTPTEAIPTGAGGAVNGSWLAVERYYLQLMNCTRTGGWVTSAGACSSPGGRDVAPLRLNASISSNVSRPYARLLATRNLCSHFIGGNPGDRLRANGYAGYNWGENIGCRSGNPYSAVLGTHLFYQSERSYNGGHYRNLMNASFRQVGIGVWVSSGRVRLVIDFYGG